MARSLRIERENGVYHIINRGNYLQDLFVDEGVHFAFEKCLFEACGKCGWVLEGFCVMTNHFHLVVRTPKGNLVYGMKWLQSTFANRYHQFRKVHGKLFQGRYKSLIVEEDAYLGALLHYVHLNPVRAGICPVEKLRNYRWSSYWYLFEPRSRPDFLSPAEALLRVGNFSDTPRGRQQYQDYLVWLSANEAARKELAFHQMSRGWALGSKEFKREILGSEGLLKDGSFDAIKLEGADLQEANELIWMQLLQEGLRTVGKNKDSIQRDRKSADWKIRIAYELKTRTSAPNTWIARELNMGVPQAVSVMTSRFKAENRMKDLSYNAFIQRITE